MLQKVKGGKVGTYNRDGPRHEMRVTFRPVLAEITPVPRLTTYIDRHTEASTNQGGRGPQGLDKAKSDIRNRNNFFRKHSQTDSFIQPVLYETLHDIQIFFQRLLTRHT